jgi:hypothetical protein
MLGVLEDDMDFSVYERSRLFYGGSERKLGILIDGCEYMIKFQKETAFGVRYNHVSEHLGSRIFGLLGFSAQETYLGTYQSEPVVACRNFVDKDEQFVPFNDVGESSLDRDKERYQYSYEDIMKMLRVNSKLTNVEETVVLFWQMFVVDAFLGNFDRHGGNWGFLKKDNQYRLAPIFDNGSCLFPNMTDEDEMLRVMDSKVETEKRIYTFPTSQIKLHGEKSSYHEVIHSLAFPECNAALVEVYGRIDLERIDQLIDATEGITEMHRNFYRHMIRERFAKIIEASMDALRSRS